MSKAKISPPIVYSYIRFSTPEQSHGDSERRQLDKAKAWAAKNGYLLDNTRELADRGFSGYRGTHRSKGALGRFLSEVTAGKIPRGSILLVENIDRLSREGAVSTIRNIIGKLWDNDITLQTLSPEESYPPGSDNSPSFIALFFYLQRAQNESQIKSERGRDTWQEKRNKARSEGKLITRRVPSWLSLENNNTPKIIPEALEAISLIFELKLKDFGVGRIVGILNERKLWSPPPRRNPKTTGWRISYVHKLLKSRELLGEYQPHRHIEGENGRRKREPDGEPILNYYPIAITPEVFYSVQEKLKKNRGKGGRNGKVSNLFTHLVKCAYCGGPMRYVNKGSGPKGGSYLVCDLAARKIKCKRRSFRYDELEHTILENSCQLRPDAVLAKLSDKDEETHFLRTKLTGIVEEMSDIEKRINNLEDQIETTQNRERRKKYETRIVDLEQKLKEKAKDKHKVDGKLQELSIDNLSFTSWKNNLQFLMKQLHSVEVREATRAHLQEFIERIDVYSHGFLEEYSNEKAMKLRLDASKRPHTLFNKGKYKTAGALSPSDKAEVVYRNSVEDIEPYLIEVTTQVKGSSLNESDFSL